MVVIDFKTDAVVTPADLDAATIKHSGQAAAYAIRAQHADDRGQAAALAVAEDRAEDREHAVDQQKDAGR